MSDQTESGALIEEALEIAFGDGERDPGPTIEALRRDPSALATLAEHIRTLRALETRAGQSDGLARLEAVQTEATRKEAHVFAAVPLPSAHTQKATGAPPSNVVPIGQAPASRGPMRGTRPGALPSGGPAAFSAGPWRWVFPAVAFAMAAGLALFLWNRRMPAPGDSELAPAALAAADVRTDLSVARVQELARDAEPEAMGFAGTPLAPAARGYLVAGAKDLHASVVQGSGESTRAMAMAMADRAAAELGETPVTPSKVISGGCPALFPDAGSRSICEHGAFAYRMKRDLGEAAGDRRARTPDAVAFVTWVKAVPGANVAAVTTLAQATAAAGPVNDAERAAWRTLLDGIRPVLEASAPE